MGKKTLAPEALPDDQFPVTLARLREDRAAAVFLCTEIRARPERKICIVLRIFKGYDEEYPAIVVDHVRSTAVSSVMAVFRQGLHANNIKVFEHQNQWLIYLAETTDIGRSYAQLVERHLG